MIDRVLQNRIEHSLSRFPVVGIIGSRQSGKTTLARMICDKGTWNTVHLDLERPADLARLDRPDLYLESIADRLVVLDEIQRKPDLFPLLRSLVDDAPGRAGRFLILGSASPSMIRQSSESLAGRIVYHELTPFLIGEVGHENWRSLWVRGGYPLSFLSETEADGLDWREAFIMTFLERDLPQLEVRAPAERLRRFWEMVAHSQGQVWNASKVASSLGVSAPTVRRYLDILQETFMVRQMRPYHPNLKKRLVKAPKVYIRDSGLLHALLRVPDEQVLLGTPHAGSSFEGCVVEQIHALLPSSWPIHFFRTTAGAEMDLVLLPPGRAPVGIEIKLSRSPRLSKGFRHAFADLGCGQGYVVCPVDERYPMAENVEALPIKELWRIGQSCDNM